MAHEKLKLVPPGKTHELERLLVQKTSDTSIGSSNSSASKGFQGHHKTTSYSANLDDSRDYDDEDDGDEDDDDIDDLDSDLDFVLGEDDELEDGNPLKPEFQGLPWHQRPSIPLLLALIMISICGHNASISSMLDLLFQVICKDFYGLNDPAGCGGGGVAGGGIGNNTTSSPIPSTPVPGGDGLGVIIDPMCKSPLVSAQTGYFTTYMTTVSSIATLITIAKLGSLSDKWGRRPVILINVACTLIERLFTIACCVRPEWINYRWLLVGTAVGGLGGSFGLQRIMCASYVADSIKEVYRAKYMSYVDACLFAGIAFGPIVGSLILNWTGRNVALLLFFSLGTDFTFLLGVLGFLPESRSRRALLRNRASAMSVITNGKEAVPAKPAPSNASAATVPPPSRVRSLLTYFEPLANFLKPLSFLKFAHIRDRAQRRNVYALIAASALMSDVVGSLMSFVIILTKIKFNFTAVENNYYIFIAGSGKFVVLTFFLPFALKVGKKLYAHSPFHVDFVDKRILQFGFLCSALSFWLNAESATSRVFYISMATLSLGGVVDPILRNCIIKYAPRNHVGEVLGAVGLMTNLIGIVTPTLCAAIFKYTARVRMQFVLEFAALIELGLMLCLSFLAIPPTLTIEQVESLVEEV